MLSAFCVIAFAVLLHPPTPMKQSVDEMISSLPNSKLTSISLFLMGVANPKISNMTLICSGQVCYPLVGDLS